MRAWLLVCVGCAERLPLPSVPITGGTAEQRELARATIETFERDIGIDSVRLTEVAFGPVYGSAQGTFNSATHRIRVEDTLPPPRIERVLRHELCHALDFAEDLMGTPQPAFDALVQDLFGEGFVDTSGLGGPRHRRSESFARYCDLGPLVAHALASPCSGDRPEVNEVAAYLSEQVWRGWTPGLSHPVQAVPHASWSDLPAELGAFGVVGLADPTQIRVQYGPSWVDLGLDNGLLLASGTSPVLDPQDELPDGISHLCPGYALFPAGAGWPEGPAAVLVNFRVYDEPTTKRVLATAGDEWGLVDLCVPQPHADVFTTADGRLWLAGVEDRTVSWTPLLE